MPNRAEEMAALYSVDVNIRLFQEQLSMFCETYTQNEFTFSDGSILEFHMSEAEDASRILHVRTFANRGEYTAADPGRPERPPQRPARPIPPRYHEKLLQERGGEAGAYGHGTNY